MRLLSAQKLFFTSYLLFLFFLPTQLGKHFWPPFSFVSGLRIDYLSPTLFFTDVLLGIVFVCFLLTKPDISLGSLSRKNSMLLFLFVFVLLTGIVSSQQPLAGFMGVIRLTEMVICGYLTKQFFNLRHAHKAAMIVLGSSMVFQATLGMAQFFLKGSLNGVFYFFGERSFSMVTPGIANASLHGTLILRPYGTLPHPNVLAGFLLISLLFLAGSWKYLSTRLSQAFTAFAISIGSGALLLSLSRSTLGIFVVLLLGFGGYVLKRAYSKKILAGIIACVVVLCIFVVTTPVAERFLSSSFFEEAFLFREDVAKHAIIMVWEHPLFGVGLQNFLYHLPMQVSSFAFFTQVQPVHTIYLLAFAELGIGGGVLFLYGLFIVLRRGLYAVPSFWQKTVVGMFCVLLLLGLFDHYLLTIHQGRLLLAFVIGLIFSLPQKQAVKHTRKRK